MSGNYDAVTSRYLLIDAGAVPNWLGAGWGFYAHIYPDSAIAANSFAYIYSDVAVGVGVPGLNVFKVSPSGKIRVTCDSSFTKEIDITTSNAVIADQWNGIVVTWDGFTLKIFLNGILTSTTSSFLSSMNPTSDGRVGYAVAGGSRQWNGKICHVSKFGRTLTNDEGNSYSTQLISPQFAQNAADWHFEMFRGNDLAFDMVGNATATEFSMVYGDHSPAVYPEDNFEAFSTDIVQPGAIMYPQHSHA